MHTKTFILRTIFVYLACYHIFTKPVNANDPYSGKISKTENDINPYKCIREIPVPSGYTRLRLEADSFGKWLLDLHLKKDKTVYLFNGLAKRNQSAQFAVIDISVGTNNLQQCADAVMRLRAEYLFTLKKYQAIQFTDNVGTCYRFSEPFTQKNLQLYLQRVYGMCGSASLSKQLFKKPIHTIQPGDVIIRGGFPGHAVIVMDVASNREGKKIYLLAQSYMPAQDIHLLLNPLSFSRSPWYDLNEQELIRTPEYTFKKEELKGW